MKNRLPIVLFLLVLVSNAVFGADGARDEVKAWIEQNVPEMMREAHMPGFSIAVVRDGATIYAEGFGARDPAQGLPATPDTLYGIGSITKSFVALAVLQLEEQGKLKLTDAVSEYVPFELGMPGKPITIWHLLTHTPGFPNLATSTVLLGRGLGEDTGVPMGSAADFFRFVNGARDEVIFEPGVRFFYNNAAWRILGAIVQQVSGMPFHAYVTEYVIRPLGMQRTTFDTLRLFADADHLVPHRQGNGAPEATPFPYPNPEDNPEFSFLSAAGGISSSAIEMTRYLNALIEMGAYPGGRLVSRQAMQAMQSLQVRRGDGYYGEYGYGYGLGITPGFLGEKMVEHGGSIRVSTAKMAFVPKHRIGVVMLGNSGGMDYATIAESVLAILMGRDPAAAVPALVIRERMQRLTGEYAIYRDMDELEIIEKGDMLYIRRGENLAPLIPESEDYRDGAFYLLSEGIRTPVEFSFGDDGTVTMLLGRYVYRKTR